MENVPQAIQLHWTCEGLVDTNFGIPGQRQVIFAKFSSWVKKTPAHLTDYIYSFNYDVDIIFLSQSSLHPLVLHCSIGQMGRTEFTKKFVSLPVYSKYLQRSHSTHHMHQDTLAILRKETLSTVAPRCSRTEFTLQQCWLHKQSFLIHVFITGYCVSIKSSRNTFKVFGHQ